MNSESSENTIAGVDGWLAFLVAGLIVLGPLLGVSRLYSEFVAAEQSNPQLLQSALYSSYKTSSWAIFAITTMISISAGYALSSRHRPSTVTFAIACLWVIGPVGDFAYIIASALIFGAIPSLSPEMVGSIVGSAARSAIWTAYLLRSKRVKNTYRLTQHESTRLENRIRLEREQGLKPNFNNRDDYLKWKEQRLKNIE